MTIRAAIANIVAQEDLNFLLTNRLPRRLATTLVGRLSRIEHPLVARLSIWAWRLFSDLDLSEARDRTFRSMHACFTRALREGARPVARDADVLASPCDGIVGAMGQVRDGMALQIKGSPYPVADLLGGDGALPFRDGVYVTLRLTAAMYHRFHAPHDCTVVRVRYLSGDTWNVNPIALKRIERLFCRNERAVIALRLDRGDWPVLLVPVAAILVAGIRLNFLDTPALLRQLSPAEAACDVGLAKGEEMGWFEHGSTIILFAPPGFTPAPGVAEGARIRAGEPLLRLPAPDPRA